MAGEMTRKEALAALHKLCEESIDHVPMSVFLSEEHKALRKEVRCAFDVLDRAFHCRKSGQFSSLCERCYLRYAECIAEEKEKDSITWCCTSCWERLKAEGKLEAIEAEGTHEEGVVAP
jgi:hypothetical protein